MLRLRSKPPATPRRAGSPTGRALLVLLCALAAAITGPTAARAADPAFALQPVGVTGAKQYFVLSARPGRALTRQIRVVNVGHATGAVRLFAVDATTGQTTGAVYQGAEVAKRDVGAWTHLGRSALRLAPGQSAVVSVTVRVPRGAASGTHLGGIVAQNLKLGGGKPLRRGKGRFAVRIRSLTVTAVQIEIPGPRTTRVALTGVVRPGGASGGHQAVLVGLRNTGNTLAKPRLRILLRKGSGVLQRTEVKLDTILPRTEILYPVQVRRRALAQGDYTAEVALSDARGHVQQQAASKFSVSQRDEKQVFGNASPLAQGNGGSSIGSYVPWILVALLGGAALLMFRRQRRLPS